jgi:hypothetical protein
MATTKRSKRGRAVATRAKASARSAKSAKVTKTSTKKLTKTSAKKSPKGAARSAGKAKPIGKAVAKPTLGGAKRAVTKSVADSAEVVAIKAKFQRERNGLQKNLTEAVREIGLLRHHELRVTQLERQLVERDAIIGRLQTQLAELQRRPAEPVYVHEVQQTLALVIASPQDAEAEATALEEFEDDRLPEEHDVVSDDE